MTADLEKFMEPIRMARKQIAKDQPWLREYYEKAIRHGPNEACCRPVAGFIEEVINLRRENAALRAALDPDAVALMVQEAVKAEREACADIANEFHRKALLWAKKIRGLEKHIGETDSSRIAAAIRARGNDVQISES